ncbi:MAG: hypothetical protein ACOY3N_09270 [Bradyrhizobium sp.]|uniref:hypothetical protein n=1 Tax=Bradyrhizobium sp. TaxID=376 RepID=UPI003BF1BE2D
MSEIKKCADDWLRQPKYACLTVRDPDGWDRKNFEASWAEEITEQEFNRRLLSSTCIVWPTA